MILGLSLSLRLILGLRLRMRCISCANQFHYIDAGIASTPYNWTGVLRCVMLLLVVDTVVFVCELAVVRSVLVLVVMVEVVGVAVGVSGV